MQRTPQTPLPREKVKRHAHLSLRIPVQLMKDLDKLRKQFNTSRNEIINTALRDYVRRIKEETEVRAKEADAA